MALAPADYLLGRFLVAKILISLFDINILQMTFVLLAFNFDNKEERYKYYKYFSQC